MEEGEKWLVGKTFTSGTEMPLNRIGDQKDISSQRESREGVREFLQDFNQDTERHHMEIIPIVQAKTIQYHHSGTDSDSINESSSVILHSWKGMRPDRIQQLQINIHKPTHTHSELTHLSQTSSLHQNLQIIAPSLRQAQLLLQIQHISTLLAERERQLQALLLEDSTKLSKIIQLQQANSTLTAQIVQLQSTISRCEALITLQSSQAPPKTIIRQVPVYIQKEILVQVAVPIYIKQKPEQKYLPQHTLSINEVFQEENSFAINELSADYQQSDANSETKRSNFKFGNCKSFQQSQIQSSVERQEPRIRVIDQPRERIVKQIVEVPVYIEKEVVRQVEREVVVQKEVMVEREVVRYIQAGSQRNSQNVIMKFDEEGCILDGPGEGQNHESFVVGRVSSVFIHKEDYIQEESHQSEREASELIIQVPVVIEKEVIVIKQEYVFVEVPVQVKVGVQKQIIVEKEVFIEKEVVVYKEIIVQKPIFVQKPVFIEKEVIIQKEVMVEKEVIVQKQVIVQKIIQKIVPHEVIIERSSPPSQPLTPTRPSPYKNMKIYPNLPQQIAFHFDLSDHLQIQKILVTQQHEKQLLRRTHTLMREFIHADEFMEGLIIDILEIPVEILIQPKDKEIANLGVQTDPGNGERPVQIIVQKVIYVYDEERPLSVRSSKANLNQSVITLLNLPSNDDLPRQRDSIIIEKVLQVERPVYIQRIVQIQKVKYEILPLQIVTEIYLQPSRDSIHQDETLDLKLSPGSQHYHQSDPHACVQLSDHSSSFIQQPRNQQDYPQGNNYTFTDSCGLIQIHHPARTEKDNAIDEENTILLQEEIRYLQHRVEYLAQENGTLQEGRLRAQQEKKQLQIQMDQMETHHEKTLRETIERLGEGQYTKRDHLQAILAASNQQTSSLQSRLHLLQAQNSSNMQWFQQTIKQLQARQQREESLLVQQLQVKEEQLLDIIHQSNIQNEQIAHLRQEITRVNQQQAKVQAELHEVRRELMEKQTVLAESQLQAEERVIEVIRSAEKLKAQSELKLSTVQDLYRGEIQEIAKNHSEILQQKQSQIQQLSRIVQQLRLKQGQNGKRDRNPSPKPQKINVKIINMQNKSGSLSSSKHHPQREQELAVENQRLLEVIQKLKKERGSYEERERSPRTRIRIEQLGKISPGWPTIEDEDIQHSCNCSHRDLTRDIQLEQLKGLVQSYEEVIRGQEAAMQDLQRQQQQLVASVCSKRQYDYEPDPQSPLLSGIERYKMYRVRYYKILQATQLIKEEIFRIQGEMPQRYLDLLSNVKRFLKVIEINHHADSPKRHRTYQERHLW